MTSGELLKIDPQAPDLKTIKLASEIITNDGVVVTPTETRYGILVRADHPDNMKRVYSIKKRNENLPMAVFLNNPGELKHHIQMNNAANSLAEKFLPGPLTLVGESVSALKAPVVINGKIGLRVSSNPLIIALTEQLDLPLSATSANLSGQPEPVSCREVFESLGDEIDLYLDGGNLEGPVSTVIDVSTTPPKLLREGALSRQEVVAVVGEIQ